MNKASILALLALLFVSSITFDIKSIDHQYKPQSSQQYVQYVKAIMGMSSQNQLASNKEVQKIVQNQRISILNSVEQVVLILIDQFKKNPQLLPTIKDIQSIQNLDQQIKNFQVIYMANFDIQTVNRKISELQALGKMVNTLQISNQLSQQIKNHSQRKLLQTKTQTHHEGVQQQYKKVQQGTSLSYITKFFFSIVFIIVCLGALSTIANMQNRKDTLLYAKFIADVGQR